MRGTVGDNAWEAWPLGDGADRKDSSNVLTSGGDRVTKQGHRRVAAGNKKQLRQRLESLWCLLNGFAVKK
jgi:hypothetical protein